MCANAAKVPLNGRSTVGQHGQVRYDDGDEEAMLLEKLGPLLPKDYSYTSQACCYAPGANGA